MSDDDVFTEIVLLLIIILVHVAAGDGQDRAVRREGEAGNGGGEAVELAQPLLVVPIPDVDEPVAAARGKGVVLPMEGDGVHWVNVFNAILLQSASSSVPRARDRTTPPQPSMLLST